MLERPENLRDAIMEALGAASVCWENPGGAGVFDSEHAKDVGEELIHWIRENELKRARLGYATTRQLIAELEVRADVADINGEDWPAYRTVDGG